MSKRKISEWQKAAREAADKLQLAGVYLDDGALNSAAKNYRAAADLLEQAQAARNAVLGDTLFADPHMKRRHALAEHLRGLAGVDEAFLDKVEMATGAPAALLSPAVKAAAKASKGDAG